MALDISVEAQGWSGLPEAGALAQQAAEAAIAAHGGPGADNEAREARDACEACEVGVLLTDDARIRDLNRSWRGKDTPTNVLSFPAPENPGVHFPRYLGDLALAYETLAREAEDESKPLAHHFAHLVVHGVLHLLGHDHEVEDEAQLMEALEVKALATLGIADPYRDMAA
ncbi:MAG: rRNA maturation RNase YbeY [Microvirga sp.]